MNFSAKQKHILQILADGMFHSGTELAESINFSRSAVWKHLRVLAEQGVDIIAVSGKGYRLTQALELLDNEKLIQALSETALNLINDIEIHDQIHSTNSYLVEQKHNNVGGASLCLAESQTAGRGRRGRQWISPFGSNLYLSLRWRFQRGFTLISGLSLAVGIAVIKALELQQINGIGLKWPNDIFYQEKKLGGILIEVSGESDGPCHVVIGIGLNVFLPGKHADEIDQDWTDLSKITGRDFLNRNELAASIFNELLLILSDFEVKQIQHYLDTWRKYDCMLGKNVTLFMGHQSYSGTVQGIDDKGMLLLKLSDGETKVFSSGEVSFNPSKNPS